jgi:hypothetical protein
MEKLKVPLRIITFTVFLLISVGYFYHDSLKVKEQHINNKAEKSEDNNNVVSRIGLYKNSIFIEPTVIYGVVGGVEVKNYTEIDIGPGDIIIFYFGNDYLETFSFDGFPTEGIVKIDSKGNTLPYESRALSDYYGTVIFKSSVPTMNGVGINAKF